MCHTLYQGKIGFNVTLDFTCPDSLKRPQLSIVEVWDPNFALFFKIIVGYYIIASSHVTMSGEFWVSDPPSYECYLSSSEKKPWTGLKPCSDLYDTGAVLHK